MRARARKDAVDHRVAAELTLDVGTVAAITKCFLRHTAALLVEQGELRFSELGRFRVQARAGTPTGFTQQHVVYFKKAGALTKAITARSKEVPYGEIWSERDGDGGVGEAGGEGVPGVRSET